jgi:phosphopantothenoylcysteine decarboxylase/phosphopantothenate--cysteine ligase
MKLSGKKILLGITGSIAAYKTPFLVRELVKAGAEVKIITTPSALQFVTPVTLATLSKNPVLCEYTNLKTGEWSNHVELGLWADLFIIAPATANTMAKMAQGICDNLLMATWLSARCPVWVAPAMDLDMYKHFTTQNNLKTLSENNITVLEPDSGELASGLTGKGRMQEPEKIFQSILHFFNQSKPLSGKTVLITAGPTYEKIDPVRFIGNFSSGKMGFALAEKAAELGAKVTLISGPVHLKTNNPTIVRIDVTSADDMFNAVNEHFFTSNIFISAAAVADYKPEKQVSDKIKKSDERFTLSLTKNKDILKHFGNLKKENQIVVGFALETSNEKENALSKLKSKNADMIVLNSLNDKGAGFQSDTNKISILLKNGDVKQFQLKNKTEVAKDILNEIISQLKR